MRAIPGAQRHSRQRWRQAVCVRALVTAVAEDESSLFTGRSADGAHSGSTWDSSSSLSRGWLSRISWSCVALADRHVQTAGLTAARAEPIKALLRRSGWRPLHFRTFARLATRAGRLQAFLVPVAVAASTAEQQPGSERARAGRRKRFNAPQRNVLRGTRDATLRARLRRASCQHVLLYAAVGWQPRSHPVSHLQLRLGHDDSRRQLCETRGQVSQHSTGKASRSASRRWA